MQFLERPHLDALARAGLDAGSVALHGSLGYGKTSVLRSALRAVDTPVARCETAPWDRDRLAALLVDAIAVVRPDFGTRTRALIESGAGAVALGASLASDLGHVRAPIIIAIDDAGDILGEPSTRELLRTFAGAAPDAHFIVAGRRETASLLRGPVAVLREVDLRFTADEIARLAGIGIDDVARILIATAGWPAAVALTVSAETIPEITRAALEPLAVYERLPVERANAYRSLGAFIDAGDGYVTMQPVIRARLLEAMGVRDDGSLPRAHRLAAEDAERSDRLAQAFYHFEAAGDSDSLVAFLLRNIPSLGLSVDPARIEVALRGTNGGASEALAEYVGALRAHAAGDPDAIRRFDDAAQHAAANDAPLLANIATMRAIEGEIARGSSVAPERIARAGTGPAVAVLESWNAAIRGEFESAFTLLAPYDLDLSSREGSSIEIARAYAETALGHVERAKHRMDALIAALESSDRVILHLQALIWYARFALLWGETAIALDYANEAQRRSNGFAETESAALYAALAEATAHAGNADDALHWSRELRRHAGTAWYAVDAARLAAIADQQTARALFARGDVAGARAIAEASADDAFIPIVQRAALLADAAAYICIAGGSGTEAIAKARSAARYAQPLDAVDGIAMASAEALLEALHIAAGGTPGEGAEPEFFAALARARDGSVRLPVAALALRKASRGEVPDALRNALEVYTARGPRFEAAVLRALAQKLRVDAPGARIALPEQLTEREAQVLELLVEGLTNREIGERLILGTRTVETHVERILGKLGVGSRTRAIAAALRLGLVQAYATAR